jgi:hypothetical protein
LEDLFLRLFWGFFRFHFYPNCFIHGGKLVKKLAKSLGLARDGPVFDKSIF